MRVYLDTCCLNRPLDDQASVRVRLEAEAVLAIMRFVAAGEWQLVASEMHYVENLQNGDLVRQRSILGLLSRAAETVRVEPSILESARGLEREGFKPVDAIHLAAAQAGEADIFLTVDDRLYKKAQTVPSINAIPVANPLRWLQESGIDIS